VDGDPPPTATRSRFCNATAQLLHELEQVPTLDITENQWIETCYKAVHPDTGEAVEYKQLQESSEGHLWTECCAKEIRRLAQEYKCISGTNTIHFIKVDQIPPERKATYLRLVVADRPNKDNTKRVRFTVGGDKIDYPGEVATKTAGLTTAKILLNSTISTPGARFCAFDIKGFYSNTPMERYKYMHIYIQQIPKTIFDSYNLQELVHNNQVYVEIRKGMYGLSQAGILANKQLIKYLQTHGYHQSPHTHSLFTHKTCPIAFSLVVDDVGIKYVGKEHAQHLFKAFSSKYTVTAIWIGKQFLGMTLDWDYTNGTVDISMPRYIAKALQRFHHSKPTKLEHAPH
jgi:Reverse transcriptase (RNA-dependent DNA polymerase)